jgi:transcriptional regulator with XRE-family HTH domain
MPRVLHTSRRKRTMADITMTTLGERIRELRMKRDYSLREFARNLEVSAAFLSDIELGRRYPSDELLGSIARKLGTPVEQLRVLDHRASIDELRRRATVDPQYAFALRKMVEKNLTPNEILDLVNKARGETRKGE